MPKCTYNTGLYRNFCAEADLFMLSIKSYSHYKSTHTLQVHDRSAPFRINNVCKSDVWGQFLIDDVCVQKGIKLVRPFVRKQKQLSTEDAELNASIARARVHIERSNQKLTSVPNMEQIFLILCAVVNLSTPILPDERF